MSQLEVLRHRLSDHREDLERFLRTGLSEYARERPDTPVATAGLYWIHGSVLLSLDTAGSSAAFVAAEQREGGSGYGRDDWGPYGDSFCDFDLHGWRRRDRDFLRELYYFDGPQELEYPDGEVLRVGDELEEADRVLFSFLVEVVRDLEGTPELAALPKSDPFRLGVELHDYDAWFWAPGREGVWSSSCYGGKRIGLNSVPS